MTNELSTRSEQPLAVRDPSPAQILAAVVERGVTPETIGTVREIIAIQREERALEAKRSYIRAMKECRKETGKIVAMKKGGVNNYYADMEAVEDKLSGILDRYGFIYSFKDGERTGDRSTVICVVDHIDGHTEEYPFALRDLPGNRGMNDALADLGTNTLGKRRALCNAFAVRIANSDDARILGQSIDGHTAAALHRRALLTVSEKMLPVLWTRFGAKCAEEIPQGKLAEVEAMLAANEAKKGITHAPEIATAETPDADPTF